MWPVAVEDITSVNTLGAENQRRVSAAFMNALSIEEMQHHLVLCVPHCLCKSKMPCTPYLPSRLAKMPLQL